MGKKLAIILLVLLMLTAVVVIETVLYLKKQQIISGQKEIVKNEQASDLLDLPIEPTSGLPLELSVNFDPTQNAPRFMIQSVDNRTDTLTLKSVWPKVFADKKIISQIDCSEVKITNPKNKSDQYVSIEQFINIIESTSKELMIFSGLCRDTTCMEIFSNCHLFISELAL